MYSHVGQISKILAWAKRLRPATILDIGSGSGQYGVLLRTHLDQERIYDLKTGVLRPKGEWPTVIDAIEGNPALITPVHRFCYNEVFIEEALTRLGALPDRSYECAIAIDIIEHFEREDGFRLLNEMRRVASVALVSTPKVFKAQHFEIAPLEDHRSLWERTDLENTGFYDIIDDPDSWIAVCTV